MSFFQKLAMRLAAAFISAGCLAADKLPQTVKFENNGSFIIDSYLKGQILQFGPDWTSKAQNSLSASPGQPRTTPETFHVEGNFPAAVSGKSFQLMQDVVAIGRDAFRYEVKMTSDVPVECKSLALALALPGDELNGVLKVDGKTVEMSDKMVRKVVCDANAETIELLLPNCRVVISGTFKVLVQGMFPQNNDFAIRISPRNVPAQVKDWKMQIDFRIVPLAVATTPLELKPVANMGFADDKAGDGKGGWTDQGSENDLRILPTGTLPYSGLDFNIINPAVNQGKSCIVLSGNQQKYPKTVTVKIDGATKTGRYLYLLHASAWPPSDESPVGKIVAEYRNGSKREIPVLNWRDCGNWWTPHRGRNSAVAWEGKNASSVVGIYFSRFYLEEIPAQLTFESGSANVWMIVAGTLADRMIIPAKDGHRETVIKAGKDWLPLEFTGQTIPGSALDFSRYLDAPAGKYGPVVVAADGHFAFKNASNKRIRFFGPNLVGTANYLNKEQADEFVRKAVCMGYNTIRFHHFEYSLLQKGAADSLTFDPEALDKLDYLFAELKKHGIYLTIDLYASRMPKAGDGIEECSEFKRYEMKALVPISPSAFRNWQEFARRLLTHKNPYTGMSWAEDPALYSLNLINENPLVQSWRDCPITIPIYEKKFVEYLKARNLSENPPERDGLFVEFLNDLQAKCIDAQISFLRDEIKLTALITDLNHLNLYSLAGLRDKLDFVDNHQYYDHPRFAGKRWGFPFIFTGNSSIAANAVNPRGLMSTRIFGKPFTVTEFNFCNPNPYRMECAPLVGGYAGLQDWDGLYRFAWSHSRYDMFKIVPTTHFDIVNNPQAQLAERIIHMLFVRGDVRKADPAFAFVFSPQQIRDLKGLSQTAAYPQQFTELGLYCRIGSIDAAKSFPGVSKVDALAADWTARLPFVEQNVLAQLAKTGKITSATGEISLDSTAVALKICTPKSEVVTAKTDVTGAIMTLRNVDRFQTVAVMSLDDLDLARSSRILLLHLPNMAATELRFSTGNQFLLEDWGKLPLLLENVKVGIELALPVSMKVQRLKLDGSPAGELQTGYQNGKLSFTADTAAEKGGTMVYLLTR